MPASADCCLQRRKWAQPLIYSSRPNRTPQVFLSKTLKICPQLRNGIKNAKLATLAELQSPEPGGGRCVTPWAAAHGGGEHISTPATERGFTHSSGYEEARAEVQSPEPGGGRCVTPWAAAHGGGEHISTSCAWKRGHSLVWCEETRAEFQSPVPGGGRGVTPWVGAHGGGEKRHISIPAPGLTYLGLRRHRGGSLDTKPLEAKGTEAESSRRRQGVGGASPPGAGAAAHGGGKGERLDPGAGVVW